MKGVALIIAISVFAIAAALGSPPIKEPVQYEQLSNSLNVSGTGIIDMSASAVDKRIALAYFNSLSGNGSLEMNSERIFSESARKISRDIGMDNLSNMNLFERSMISYSSKNPLVGSKSLSSKSFYGGIGANARESFMVKEFEGDLKSYFGSTSTATDAHVVGFDTKSAFNGTWEADTDFHKLLEKDIKSHQSFSGKFEIDRQVKLHEKAVYKSAIKCTKTPSSANVSDGDSVTYQYVVSNPSDTVISGINLVDSDIGKIKLDRTALGPNESTKGTGTYTVTEDDILAGPRETIATVTGVDNLNERVESRCSSWLVPVAEYYDYEGSISTAAGCPGSEKRDQADESSSCARYETAPGTFNLRNGSLTIYALDINMTECRYPVPGCPYKGWPDPQASAMVELGATSGAEANSPDPSASVWQRLSLEHGAYLAGQGYRGVDQSAVSGAAYRWNTPYAGESPNGGFHCTGDPQYDSFDLKMVLTDLGPGAGFRADSYQRVYESADRSEDAYEWRKIGSQEVPEDLVDKTAVRPFILVANSDNSTGGGAISWSKIIAAD